MNDQTEEIREKRESKVSGVLKYFNAIMGVFYVVFSIVFYLNPFIEGIDAWAKIAISLVLMAYGLFRVWRSLWR
ncbi:MAG: hypothetical protein SGJ00_09340 [bacterium]|nr:hypothetical protein [bacterium]